MFDQKQDKNALDRFLEVFQTEMEKQVSSLNQDALNQAADLIIEARIQGNRLHFSGIGKPSYVAGYAASLVSSTGTPAYVLHGTEAVHGSAGQLMAGDVVVLISNSGETSELLATAQAARNNGALLIGITGNDQSSIALLSACHILANVDREGGPLDRAPRTSIMAELLVVQALSVLLQEALDLSPQEYIKRHPGGALGQLRAEETAG